MTWGRRNRAKLTALCLLSRHQFPFHFRLSLSAVVLNDSQILPGWLIKGKWRQGSTFLFFRLICRPPQAQFLISSTTLRCSTSIPIAYRWIISFCHHHSKTVWRQKKTVVELKAEEKEEILLTVHSLFHRHSAIFFSTTASAAVQHVLKF